MFTYVNEIAVIGTALFMTAVAMIWYSEYCFQKVWMKAVGFTNADLADAERHSARNFAITFGAFLIAAFIMGLFVSYAEVFGVSVRLVALALALCVAALLAGFVVFEQRSLSYYLVTAGFSSVFIVGSAFLLHYWPW